MRTTRDRIRHAVSFEILALGIVVPLGAFVFSLPASDIGVVSVGSATIAMLWNYVYKIGFDRAMWRQDIRGSLAHAAMLAHVGIISAEDETSIRDGLEVDRAALDLVTFYARNLGVPERRDVGDATVLHGKRLFHELGCASCHTPKMVTGRLEGRPEQSFQLIWPYSDLLLHDMGEGLADNRPEGRASGSEWKTPPLWGIGLTEQVSGHSEFLHDGRARNLLEAVLWHGGEAEAARNFVLTFNAEQRAALLAFLNSL